MIRIYSALLLLLFVACPALAQYTNPRATVFVAGSFPSADRAFAVGGRNFETDLEKGARVGVRLTADLTDRWGAEAAYSFGSNDFRAVDSGPPPETRVFDSHQHRFKVNGLMYFAPGDRVWRPFATAGLNLTLFVPTGDAKDAAAQNFLTGPTRISTATRFGINFGGGVEREVNEYLLIRADVRDYITGIPRYGLPDQPLNPGGVSFPATGAMHDIEIAVGFVLRLQR
jgi:hypothetical protein